MAQKDIESRNDTGSWETMDDRLWACGRPCFFACHGIWLCGWNCMGCSGQATEYGILARPAYAAAADTMSLLKCPKGL